MFQKYAIILYRVRLQKIKKSSAQNGYTAQCSVVVQTSITDISINKTDITIEKSSTLQIEATINPLSTTEKAIWISSDEQIATVDDNGMLTAKEVGNVTITVQNANGKIFAKCSIKIVPMPITITAENRIAKAQSKLTVLNWNGTLPSGAKSVEISWKCGVDTAISDRKYSWTFIDNDNGTELAWTTNNLGVNANGNVFGVSRSISGIQNNELKGGTSYSIRAEISSFLNSWENIWFYTYETSSAWANVTMTFNYLK